jgi:hypothetical protein
VNEAREAVSVAAISPEEEETPPPRPPLRTLAGHNRYIRPLPDLLPFPFKADEPVYRKKNNTKVPKPSKFP